MHRRVSVVTTDRIPGRPKIVVMLLMNVVIVQRCTKRALCHLPVPTTILLIVAPQAAFRTVMSRHIRSRLPAGDDRETCRVRCSAINRMVSSDHWGRRRLIAPLWRVRRPATTRSTSAIPYATMLMSPRIAKVVMPLVETTTRPTALTGASGSTTQHRGITRAIGIRLCMPTWRTGTIPGSVRPVAIMTPITRRRVSTRTNVQARQLLHLSLAIGTTRIVGRQLSGMAGTTTSTLAMTRAVQRTTDRAPIHLVMQDCYPG